MLKFWIFVIIALALAALGLSLGSANGSVVAFDFLIVQYELPLAMVFVLGAVFGLVIGLLITLTFALKMWGKAHKSKVAMKKAQKEQLALKKAQEAA